MRVVDPVPHCLGPGRESKEGSGAPLFQRKPAVRGEKDNLLFGVDLDQEKEEEEEEEEEENEEEEEEEEEEKEEEGWELEEEEVKGESGRGETKNNVCVCVCVQFCSKYSNRHIFVQFFSIFGIQLLVLLPNQYWYH